MGCLVPRSTTTEYERNIADLDSRIYELEDKISHRQKEHTIYTINPSDPLGYIAYQEQLRENFIISQLHHLFSHTNGTLPNDPEFMLSFQSYSQLKIQQTNFESELILEFLKVSDNIKELNEEKRISIDTQIESILENNKSRIKNSEKILSILRKKTCDLNDVNSLENLVEVFLLRSELDREIALLQRIYEFREFIQKEDAKQAKKNESEKTVRELKQEARELNEKCSTLKDEEKKQNKEIRESKKVIQSLEERIQKALIEKAELEELKLATPDNTRDLERAYKRVSAKKNEIEQMNEFIKNLNEELTEIKCEVSFNELKIQNKSLKEEMATIEIKVKELRDQKMQALEEKRKIKQKEIDAKTKQIEEIKTGIKEKQESMMEIQKNTKFILKKQVLARLINTLNMLLISSFRFWKHHSIQIKSSLSHIEQDTSIRNSFLSMELYKNVIPWEPEKLYDFLDEFMKEKYKSDNARSRHNKIPKTMIKFLRYYMKTIYKSTNETDREINKMFKSLIVEEKRTQIASAMKKFLEVDEDKLPFHISIIFTGAWNEFDYIKIVDCEESAAYLFDIMGVIEEFVDESNWKTGSKMFSLLRRSSPIDDDIIMLVMKSKFNNFQYKLPDKEEGIQAFIEKVQERTRFYIPDESVKEFIMKYYNANPSNYPEKINADLRRVDKTKDIVSKNTFLSSFIEIYQEEKTIQAAELEAIIKAVPNVNKDSFSALLRKLDPSINANAIRKMFEESLLDENESIITISPEFFVELMIKYGVAGYGVGPFKPEKLKCILFQYLNKDKKALTRRQPSDVVPYKITVETAGESPNKNSSEAAPNRNILDILPSKNIRLPIPKKSRSPSPTSHSNPFSKVIATSKFFNSKPTIKSRLTK